MATIRHLATADLMAQVALGTESPVSTPEAYTFPVLSSFLASWPNLSDLTAGCSVMLWP